MNAYRYMPTYTYTRMSNIPIHLYESIGLRDMAI